MPKRNKKLALKLGIQITDLSILTNDDEVCIPSLSSILLAVITIRTYSYDLGSRSKRLICEYLEEKQSTRQDYKHKEIASKEGTPEGIETWESIVGRL